ncbi:MAG: FliG C-terminal domain-containing protein [Pirellulales bacterium]
MNASSSNSASTLENRLRQIAILVASVDTTAARQLLMHMPTEVAKRVRAMAANIGPVPPEERRALLAEFQKSQVQSKSMSVTQESARPVTDAPSPSGPSGLQSPVYAVEPSVNSIAEPSWTRLGVETLVRLVKIERPTVIAVVLQQLPAAQAAAVLQRLPRSTTREVLQTLGSMQDIDEEARQAIDEHLSERLRDYHHKMESELEQNRRMTELLSAAPPELKQQWAAWLRPDVYIDENSVQSARPVSATVAALNTLDRLYQSATITTSDATWQNQSNQLTSNSANSSATGSNSQSQPASASAAANNEQSSGASQAVFGALSEDGSRANSTKPKSANSPVERNANSVSGSRPTSAQTETSERPHTIPFPGVRTNDDETPSLSDGQRKAIQAKMEKMLSLKPEQLAQLLSSLDSQTILYSLAGASPSFMKRFCNMLVPEDTTVLDQRLRRIGTVSLREIDQAQQRLANAYDALVNSMGLSRGLFGTRSGKRAA